MSMICWVQSVSQPQIAALRATPSLASDLVWVAQHDGMNTRREEMLKRLPPEKRQAAEARYKAALELMPKRDEFDAQIFGARARLAGLGDLEPAFDLQKSWHILHYLFTGDVGPVGSPGDGLMAGEDLGEDVGYGPPRLLDVDGTRSFAQFLEALDAAELAARVKYQEMLRAGLYSMPMGGGTEAEFEIGLRDEVESYFPRLRAYIVGVAAKRGGLLIWIS